MIMLGRARRVSAESGLAVGFSEVTEAKLHRALRLGDVRLPHEVGRDALRARTRSSEKCFMSRRARLHPRMDREQDRVNMRVEIISAKETG